MENASTSSETEQNDATTTEDEMEYDAWRPFVLEVKYDDGTQKGYEPRTIDEDNQHKPHFSLPHGLDLSARMLLELYLSFSFLYDVVKYTNEYGHYRAPQTFKNVTIGQIYIFFNHLVHRCCAIAIKRRLLERWDNMAIAHPMPTNEGVPLSSDLEAHSSDSNNTR